MDETPNTQVLKTFPNPSTMFKSGANAVENARKGGSVKGYTKSLGQHIRWLKSKGTGKGNEALQLLYDMWQNRDIHEFEVMKKLAIIENSLTDPTHKLMAQRLSQDLLTKIHGTKINIKSESRHEEVIVEDKRLRVEFVFPKSKEELLKDVEVRSNGEASRSDAQTH